MHHARAYSLHVASELALPELNPVDSGEPDVTVSIGEVPEHLPGEAHRGVVFESSQAQFLLRLVGVGRFLVSRDAVVIQPAEGADERDLRVFFLSTCLGALLHQRGLLVLHAAALRFGDVAVALAGTSGAGKSTLLAALLQREGYALLTDNVTAVARGADGAPQLLPGFPRIKLWADAVKRLGHDLEQLERVRDGLEKFLLPVDEAFCCEPTRLGALYALGGWNKSGLEITPIESVHRLGVLVGCTYHKLFMRGLGTRPQHFQRSAQIGTQVPMWRVRYPQKHGSLKELVNEFADRIEALPTGAAP